MIDLPLFTPPAPSVPTRTSEDAADRMMQSPFRRQSWRKILVALAAHGPMTRERLCAITGMKESSACARLFELSPQWIACEDGAGISSAGLAVNRYRITEDARRRMTEPLPLPKRT